MGMEEVIVQRDFPAACASLLHIDGQREHLVFLIPYCIVPLDSPILCHPAVRERDVEPLIRLIGPCVPKPEQLADRPAVRAVPGIAAGKPVYGSRKPERVRGAGIMFWYTKVVTIGSDKV